MTDGHAHDVRPGREADDVVVVDDEEPHAARATPQARAAVTTQPALRLRTRWVPD
jgi:hypothetical protein